MKQFAVKGRLLERLLLRETESIRAALTLISDVGAQIALVVDDKKRLIGTITDGDIRRAMLKECSLDSPVSSVMNLLFQRISEDVLSDANPIAIMQNKGVHHLPVLDADGRVISLYMMFEIAKNTCSNVPVVIMAGGLGRRLMPLTENCPKPMIELGGKAILERILTSLVTQGFTNFYFSVNYLAEVIENYFGDGHRWNANISYLHEPSRLGTAGALGEIEDKISSPIIVQNGDLLTNFDYKELLEFHSKTGSVATMGLRNIYTQIAFGVVESNGDEITKIVEKPNLEHSVNAGIYCLSPEVLPRIKRGKYLDMPDLFTGLVEDGYKCGGYDVPGSWIDVGTHAELKRARALFED